ncbi:MAG TPA: hypothetical protein VEL02_10720 [Jatrophihabitantaceae bacterium]|nr:hypothetical protein [Jatrophihabitantaceae bacterium]
MTARARLAMAVMAGVAALMAASVRVFRLEFEGMYVDWQLSEEDLAPVSKRLSRRGAVGSRPAAAPAT